MSVDRDNEVVHIVIRADGSLDLYARPGVAALTLDAKAVADNIERCLRVHQMRARASLDN